MIIRSIKLVHFRGVAELHLRDLPRAGVISPELPAGAERACLVDALRFAFLGRSDDAQSVVSSGAGYAYVEVAFRVTGRRCVSIFRGVDRRGSLQVSLREDDGMRVTGGEVEVGARLAEFAGMSLDRWTQATWIDCASIDSDSATAPADAARFVAPSRLPAAAFLTPSIALPAAVVGAAGGIEVHDARQRSERAIDALRRALRAETLRDRIEVELAALAGVGGRMRRERADASVVLDRLTTERDRVRTRAVGLSASVVALDAEIEPLRRRLEQLDEALAAFDVEIERAVRTSQVAFPPREEALSGFTSGESSAAAEGSIARIGDAIHHAAVERAALLAGGTESVEVALEEARAAFASLGRATGDPENASNALRRARAEFARDPETGEGEAGFVVLADRPRSVDDATISELVRQVAPAPRQVFVPRAAQTPLADGATSVLAPSTGGLPAGPTDAPHAARRRR